MNDLIAHLAALTLEMVQVIPFKIATPLQFPLLAEGGEKVPGIRILETMIQSRGQG
jgi:hypothetical protein